MQKRSFRFSQGSVDYYFDSTFSQIQNIVDKPRSIIVTDENVFQHHQKKFRGWATINLPAGEAYKTQASVDVLLQKLMTMQADRKTMLIGVGGGVITDLAGYVASIYMRGIPFGFVPTSVLAMVDASIGGKNGIDIGTYKNVVGTIRQPSFILHDYRFLQTLPLSEWRNGFAEIIKHAAIRDARMFGELESHNLAFYRKTKKELASLIYRNALIKTKIVQADEFEKGERKLLNFGHTLGHAIENLYGLSHGEAIAVGMAFSAEVSKQLAGYREAGRLVSLLQEYELPVQYAYDKEKLRAQLLMDKKKISKEISYILLQKTGRGMIKELTIDELYAIL